MFQGPSSQRGFVIRCKGCGENIPALVETLPASWIASLPQKTMTRLGRVNRLSMFEHQVSDQVTA
jgi:hypothetical protein